MRGGPVPTGTFDSSPVRSAGKWYRRHVRPASARDDRNARGPVSHPMSGARTSHSIVHSGTHRFLENATQHFVLGYFPMSLRDLSLLQETPTSPRAPGTENAERFPISTDQRDAI
jgi:hypothetical protein